MSTVALTIDLHTGDSPDDILRCNEWLKKANLPVTFLIPTIMLNMSKFRSAIADLITGPHELGTHSHYHNDQEKQALQIGKGRALEFLSVSKKCFEDFLGFSPHSFRSPTCCKVNDFALDELRNLDYRIDSSSTPQRLGIFSSYPFQNPWLWSKRSPYFIRDGLLEIPTSCLLFPLISPTFLSFRHSGSLAFLSLFMWEARRFDRMVINLMLHIEDFLPGGLHPKPAYRLKDLIPRTPGGWMAKHWIRERDRTKICKLVHRMVGQLSEFEFKTLKEISKQFY